MDNTPEVEPEDVQGHLIGGVPEAEVSARQSDFAKFGVNPDTFFQPDRPGYLAFRPGVPDKPAIKIILEADAALQETVASHRKFLANWWEKARNDFAQLRDACEPKYVVDRFLDALVLREHADERDRQQREIYERSSAVGQKAADRYLPQFKDHVKALKFKTSMKNATGRVQGIPRDVGKC